MKIRMPEEKWQIFFVTGLANIVTAIASSSINLALPAISEEFGASMSAVSWLPLAVTIIPSCLLLVFGRMADLFGYKRQFIGGFLVFGLASLLAGLFAKNLAGLIFFRCLQGIGHPLMISITQGLCNKSFPANERGKALGINSIFVSIGFSIGPSIAGFLLTRFSWRAIFYFNVPFCLLGIITSVFVLKKDTLKSASTRHMDWPGSLFFAVFIGLLAVSLNFSADWGLVSLKFLSCIIISLCSLFLFIYRENRTDMPLMKLSLYRNPIYALSNAAFLFSYTLQQMNTFLLPFFLINILLLSSRDSGFILLSAPAAMMIFSPIGGRLADRIGHRKPALAGLAILFTGCLLMSFLKESTSAIVVVVGLLLFGVGSGLSVPAVNTSIYSAAQVTDSGMVSGMVATVRNLGSSLGVVFASAIMTMRQNRYFAAGAGQGAGVPDVNKVYLMAQRDVYYFGLFVIVLAMICMIAEPKADKPQNLELRA